MYGMYSLTNFSLMRPENVAQNGINHHVYQLFFPIRDWKTLTSSSSKYVRIFILLKHSYSYLSILRRSVAVYCGGVYRTKALGARGSWRGRRTPSFFIPSARPEHPPVYPINGILKGLERICLIRASWRKPVANEIQHSRCINTPPNKYNGPPLQNYFHSPSTLLPTQYLFTFVISNALKK